MGNFNYFTLGRRNMDCENHWEQLPSYYFRITKPTVLCFGGTGTVTSRDANAMCKIAQGLVGLKLPTEENEWATTKDVDFIGVGYGLDEESGKRIGSFTEAEKTNFVNNIFMPLCKDEKGKILPKQQILKNFNQITFFAHCNGAHEVSSLVGRTFRQMRKEGIDYITSDEAIDQMFAVSYAPNIKCGCPNLQVIPMRDILLRTGAEDSCISKQFISKRLEARDYSRGTVAYKEDDITVSVLVSGMLKHHLDEHPISYASRDEDWKYMYASRGDYGDEVSQVMGYALASSVANSIQNQTSDEFIPKPSIDKVLEDTRNILGESQNPDFEEIINQIIKKEASYELNDSEILNDSNGVRQEQILPNITNANVLNISSATTQEEDVEF